LLDGQSSSAWRSPISTAAESDGPELAARASEVRAQLAPDEQARFDAELAKAHDLRLTGYVVEAWARMLRASGRAGHDGPPLRHGCAGAKSPSGMASP
jgi:hypothetical protein